MSLAKFIIGSAQFGMDYGIANTTGKVNESELQKILNFAHEKKINLIDTAPVYGSSEEVLGKYANHHTQFISKTPSISTLKQVLVPRGGAEGGLPATSLRALGYLQRQDPEGTEINHLIQQSCNISLQRLKRQQLHGLLIHNADDLLSQQGPALYEAITALKSQNKVKKIGISVYSPEQATKILEQYPFDIIQFPCNVLDQRFLKSALLQNLKETGIELHARSIFLQGLLLMKELPNAFASINPIFSALTNYAHKKRRSLRQLLIDFIISNKAIDYFMIGVDNFQQLKELVSEIETAQEIESEEFASYACSDLNIINPSKWATKRI